MEEEIKDTSSPPNLYNTKEQLLSDVKADGTEQTDEVVSKVYEWSVE